MRVFALDTCKVNLTLTVNRAKGFHLFSDTNVVLTDNNMSWSQSGLDNSAQIIIEQL